MKKRRFGDIDTQRKFGLCVDGWFYILNTKHLRYFEDFDRDVVVCNTEHLPIAGDLFLHQVLPESLRDCPDFQALVRFVNGKKTKSPIMDFSKFAAVLAFLGSSKQLDARLLLHSAKMGPNAILRAWRQFGVICPDVNKCKDVPHVEENAGFFHAHKLNVVIRKPVDPTYKLYIPEPILEMLDSKSIVLRATQLASRNRVSTSCKYVVIMDVENTKQHITNICEIAVKYGYIITAQDKWKYELNAIAPPESQNDNFAIEVSKYKSYESELLRDGDDFAYAQFMMISPTQMCLSSNAAHMMTHGFEFSTKFEGDDEIGTKRVILNLLAYGFRPSATYQKRCETITDSELAIERRPKQLPGVSKSDTLQHLIGLGYCETLNRYLEPS
jgi:hypothetical protein